MGKEYTYTGKLKDLDYGVMAYGVIISPAGGTASAWWAPARKYRRLTQEEFEDDFINYYVETGVDVEIRCDMDFMGTGVERVWFKTKVDMTEVELAILDRNNNFLRSVEFFNHLEDKRRAAINKAANEAAAARDKFANFIRKWYFHERMNNR